MAISDEVAAAHVQLRGGPLDEAVRQHGRTAGPDTYSPHQQLTGGGIPSGPAYVDPTTVPAAPAVEHFPVGESDAHAGTYTLGREDA